MSDHPNEADQSLKRMIYICYDIYYDVFRWLTPEKVGFELAVVSETFDKLVDIHFKSRKWALGILRIESNTIVKTNHDGSEKELPFPREPLPISVVGFSSVYIRLANFDADASFPCIDRLLKLNFALKLHLGAEAIWDTFVTSVWSRLNVLAIIKIHFGHLYDFQDFLRLISSTVLCDCSNLRMITFDYGHFPPDGVEGSYYGQAMCKWLHTPRVDGQPKVLKFRRGEDFPMGALRTTFSNATTSVSFFIRLCLVYSSTVRPFKCVNSLTREQLTCRQINHEECNWWLIERSPINKRGQKWVEWRKEALENDEDDWKILNFI